MSLLITSVIALIMFGVYKIHKDCKAALLREAMYPGTPVIAVEPSVAKSEKVDPNAPQLCKLVLVFPISQREQAEKCFRTRTLGSKEIRFLQSYTHVWYGPAMEKVSPLSPAFGNESEADAFSIEIGLPDTRLPFFRRDTLAINLMLAELEGQLDWFLIKGLSHPYNLALAGLDKFGYLKI